VTTDLGTGMTVLTADACWQLLRDTEVGRLAVVIGDHPDIFPINHIVDHGTLVFRSAEGTKVAGAVPDRPVAFEVDGYEAASGEAWSVIVKGQATSIEQMHELLEASDLPLFPWHATPKQHCVRIVPEEISGRRFRVVDPCQRGARGTAVRSAAAE